MGVQEAIRLFVLGQLLADDLPGVAWQALDEGYDSPALRQLAGAMGCDVQENRAIFLKALDELELTLPEPTEAALAFAKAFASEILAGTISPYEGAKRIWLDVYNRFPEMTELRVFVGLASEFEDDPGHKDSVSP